jgi:hypothetical protein
MATTLSITSTYAGQFAGQYIAPALFSGKTLGEGGITVKPNIAYKEVIKKVTLDSNLIKDASCDFTDTGSIALTERILQPKELQVNLDICKTPFVSDWESAQMGFSAFKTLPKTFSDFLIGQLSAEVAEATEISIWRGSAATSGQFDGLVPALTADATVVDVASTASGGVTVANVIAELQKTYDAIPVALWGKEDLYIYVAQNVARDYISALGGFGASGLGANGIQGMGTQWYPNGPLSFGGVKLFVTNGLADSYMVAAQKSNLFFGTGLLSDHNLVKTLDMQDLDGSQNVRFIMRYTAGVQYGIGSDIVLYTPSA